MDLLIDESGGTLGHAADAELMGCMQRGAVEAFAVLFRRYAGLVRRVAVNILRDRAEAEDVTQEVFLEIFNRSELYDPARGSVRVWVLQYAYHRSLRRKDALSRRAAYVGEPFDEVAVVPSGPRQTRDLTRQECRWLIHDGLRRLPGRQRAAIELVGLEELSLNDAAERLRMSPGSARHHYNRGLARLRAWATHAARRDRSRRPGRRGA